MLAFSGLVYEPGVADQLDVLTSMTTIAKLPFLVNLQKF